MLSGVAPRYVQSAGAPAVARLALTLLEAGLARPADWTRSGGSPAAFVGRTVSRWVEEADQDGTQRTLSLSVGLMTRLDPNEEEDEPSIDHWLTIHASEAGGIILRPTVDMLERVHPRLPATFWRLFKTALSTVCWVYDWLDAAEHAEWIDEEEYLEATGEPRPDPLRDLPAALKRRPLSNATLRRVLRTADERSRQLLEIALEMQGLARGVDRPSVPFVPDELREADVIEPWPAFVAMVDEGDDTHRFFDEDMDHRWQVGIEAAPSMAIPFDGRDAGEVQVAHARLSMALAVFAAAARAIRLMPRATTDPHVVTREGIE